jgi:hypothetical protein
VDRRGPYPRCARRQVIPILFRLHQASHTSLAAWGTNSRAGRVHSAFLHLSPHIELSTVTDDIFKSTVHRAVNRSGVARYSIPLFFGTDYNVRLEVSMGVELVFYSSADV